MPFQYPPKNLIPLDLDKLREVAKKSNACGYRARRKLEVLRRHDFKCCECGSTVFLTVAHLEGRIPKNRGASGYRPDDCRILCVSCHVVEEYGKFHRQRFG